MSRLLDKLFKGVEILMAFFLAVMIALVFLNVILRYVFSTGFVWSEEVARLAFIYLVYFGTVGAFRDNRHLGVEMVLAKIPDKAQKALYALIQLVIIWTMWVLAQGSLELAVQNINDRWVATQYPRALVYGAGVVTGAAIILMALGNLYKLFVQKQSVTALMAIKGHDDPLAEVD